MQTVSELYKQIISDINHWFEVSVKIDGTDVGEDALMSVSVSNQLFDSGSPSVGNAVSAEVNIKMIDN